MDLAELKFVVNTEQLVDAAKKIDALTTAVSKVNKPITTAALESEKLALAQAKVAEATAKAETAQAKLKDAQEKGSKATGGSVSVLERQNMILEYMAQGLSKGQSSYMATAKAAGALDDELQQLLNTLRTQRTLQGSEPFDKSIGLYQKLQNETRISTEVNQLFNRNLGLTEKQMVDLAREKERLIALYGIEGRSLSGLGAEYEKIVQKSAEMSRSNNARNESMKAQIKAQSDAAKATAYLADADARLAAALAETNKALDKQATDALVKYEKALKQSGMSADEAAAKLSVAKKQFEGIADKKQADRLQYLARAISVQMGDVGISLASGMNPLLVMIQQGDQIRGAIQQAGASGKELEKAMAGAAGQIATSFLQTGKAIGGFFVNAVTSAGSAITKFIGDFSGVNTIVDSFKVKLAAQGEAGFSAIGTLTRIGGAFNILAGIIASGAIAALVAYGVALKEVIKQESELSKAANLSGGSLGLTNDRALTLAKSFGEAKGNVGAYMQVITELAKAGGITSNNLKTIATTIVEVSKVTGISSEELAKNFSKISEKPLEGLIPFAKQLGTINVETLKQIQNLEKSGKYTEAVKLATDAYSKSLKEAADNIKKDMGWVETFFYKIGSSAKWMWDRILNLGRAGTLDEQLNKAIDKMKELQSAGGTNTGRKDRMITAQAEVINNILSQIDAEKKLGETKAKNSKDATDFERNLKQQGGANFKVPEDLYLKRIKQEYADTTKTIDSEFKKLLAENKANYDLGLIDLGTYLSNESSLIIDQNNQKIKNNSDYMTSLNATKDIQLKAIDDMVAKESVKNKTTADAEKLQKEHTDAIKSTKEAYDNLTEGIITNNEVLRDKSVEEQVKSIARIGSLTKKVIEDSKEFGRSIEDTTAKRKLQIDLESQLIGLSGGQLARVKAQIDAEQSHITKLSALEKMAREAALALDELSLRGMSKDSADYQRAEAAVKAANKRLEEDKALARQDIVQAGIDAEILYYKQEYNRVNEEITKALVDNLGKGWKNTGKALRSVLEAELKKPITVFINAIVNSVSGMVGSGINSMLGGATGSSLGSTIGGAIGNIGVAGTTLGQLGSYFATGFKSVMTGTGTAAEMSGVASTTVGGAEGMAMQAGAYAAPIAGAIGGMALNRGISGGYSTGSTMQTVQDLATVAATAFFGPLGGLTAGAISGVINRAFGMKAKEITGEGIVGTLTTQGADVKAFEDWFQKGGWFRSNKSGRNFSKVSDTLQEYLDISLIGLDVTTKKYADALGLDASGLKDVTKSIELNLKGLSGEERQKKIEEALGGFGDELAKKLGLESFDALQKLGEQVLQQRYDLETQLLELQGDSVALRQRERDKIYETNQALFDQIKALEDKKAADEEATRAMEKLTSVTSSIVDEINRLRGVDTSKSGLEAQFAILTAQARSGDLTALAQLPEVTKGLEQIAASTAVNATDIIFARAKLAQSLQDTLGYTGGFNTSSATSMATVSAVSSSGTSVSSNVSANSSNQELLAALVTEMQGLRAEVRADVTHNAKTAKILERANQDGETLSVSATIDGGVV